MFTVAHGSKRIKQIQKDISLQRKLWLHHIWPQWIITGIGFHFHRLSLEKEVTPPIPNTWQLCDLCDFPWMCPILWAFSYSIVLMDLLKQHLFHSHYCFLIGIFPQISSELSKVFFFFFYGFLRHTQNIYLIFNKQHPLSNKRFLFWASVVFIIGGYNSRKHTKAKLESMLERAT